jgi:hypothetical protein
MFKFKGHSGDILIHLIRLKNMKPWLVHELGFRAVHNCLTTLYLKHG